MQKRHRCAWLEYLLLKNCNKDYVSMYPKVPCNETVKTVKILPFIIFNYIFTKFWYMRWFLIKNIFYSQNTFLYNT